MNLITPLAAEDFPRFVVEFSCSISGGIHMQMYVRNGRRTFAKFNKDHVKTDAVSLLKESEWLEWTPIYWNGSVPGSVPSRFVLGSFLPAAIRSAFSRKPAGFYFIEGDKGLAAARRLQASDLSRAGYFLQLAQTAGACERVLRQRRAKLALYAKGLREANLDGTVISSAWRLDGEHVWTPMGLGIYPELHAPALMHYCLMATDPDPKRFSQALEVLDAEVAGDQSRNRIFGYATLSAAMIGDPAIPVLFAAWVRAARGKNSSEEKSEIAAEWLDRWLEERRWEPRTLKRFLHLLQSRGERILRYGRRSDVPESFWQLPDLLDLRFSDLLLIMEYNLGAYAGRFLGNRKALLLLLRLAMKSKRQWNQLSEEHRLLWVKLYETVRDPDLLSKLSGWFLELRGVSLEKASGLVELVISALGDIPSEQKSREAFLLQRFDLLEFALKEAESVLESSAGHINAIGIARTILWNSNFDYIELCYHWWSAGWRGHMEAVVLEWLRRQYAEEITKDGYPSYPLWGAWSHGALWCALSNGDPKLLIALIEAPTGPWQVPDDPYTGWQLVESCAGVRQFLMETCRDPACLRMVTRILGDLARAARLRGRAAIHGELRRWVEIDNHPEPLQRLALFREMAGMKKALSSSLERIHARRERLEIEVTNLKCKEARGELSDNACIHLRKIQQFLSEPKTLARWVEKDSLKTVSKQMPGIKLNALAQIALRAIRTHWNNNVEHGRDQKDWDNALRFYYSARENKSLMKRLLYHHGDHKSDSRLSYPANARFLANLRTNQIDDKAWLAGYRERLRDESWQLTVELDPLRVLQMGNLFHTCLSAEDRYAFAAIANAFELNKRVLYLTDGNGTVIGRKLIGLTAGGKLLGFHSYGAASIGCLGQEESPRVRIKLYFDLACLRLAERAGARLDASNRDGAANELRLGADWYDDTPEEFDWWMLRRNLVPAILKEKREPVALAVLRYLHEEWQPAAGRPFEQLATLRALLWLGHEAALVIENVGPSFFSGLARHFIGCHSRSERVRSLVKL